MAAAASLVRCRTGSSEKVLGCKSTDDEVRCRTGSSETKALAV
tara:strand:- start:313 stop:441 length:129 start_codon:yes stop_codon:yes gene_type:complete